MFVAEMYSTRTERLPIVSRECRWAPESITSVVSRGIVCCNSRITRAGWIGTASLVQFSTSYSRS